VKQARAEGVRIIFLQPQFDSRAARAIAGAIGGAVAPIDSLAPDVIKNLDDIAAKIQQSLH
jgi:zinc transport system substrate-binding protein